MSPVAWLGLLLLLLLPVFAVDEPRDKRTLHFIFKGLADAFGYDIRLKNANTTLPPLQPPAHTTPPPPPIPRGTEETTLGYTGTTATDAELVPPFKFQGAGSDDEIFDGPGPTKSYRPPSEYRDDDRGPSETKETQRTEHEERSNRPPDKDGTNDDFDAYPANFGSPYRNDYEGRPQTFHGDDPYFRPPGKCGGCSETEEQKNERIFTNTDEHKDQVLPPYTTPNWEGFWDASANQGKDAHVGYNDYHNVPTESAQHQTETEFPREEENYVTSKEDAYENLKFKQAKQTAPSHSDFKVSSPEEAENRGNERARPSPDDRENNTQSASEEKVHSTPLTLEQDTRGKVYSEQLPVISTFKPKLLHALEEVEGSKQNVYVPPPFDDSFESTDSLSLTKSPKVLSTTPLTYSSTSNRNTETSLADITQHYTSQEKVNANAAGSVSPWHPPAENVKPKEFQDKNHKHDDPHYPRPFTNTQTVFHNQPSNENIVNTSESSTPSNSPQSTTAYFAINVPADNAESQDVTTKLDGYIEKSRKRIFDRSSPHRRAYKYENDYEKPLGEHAYSLSPTYTRNIFHNNNDNDSLTKHSVPRNSSLKYFESYRPQNYTAFPPFDYSAPEGQLAYRYNPKFASSEEFSAPHNSSALRTYHHSSQEPQKHQPSNNEPHNNQHNSHEPQNYQHSSKEPQNYQQNSQEPQNYTLKPESRLENSSLDNPRDLDSGNKYEGKASALVSASKSPLEPPHQSEINTHAVTTATLPSVSPVESSTLHASDSDKYSKLETFSSESPSENSADNNSSEPYNEHSKAESNLNSESPQQGNQTNDSDQPTRVSDHQKFPSENPYEFNYKQPRYVYSKLSVPPSVIPLHYPYEGSVNYPSKENPAYVYHGESNRQFPSYSSPDRVPSASGYKHSDEYYVPPPSKVYEPYVFSEDSHRPYWEKVGGYFANDPQATNNSYSAQSVPEYSYFGNNFYPSKEGYSGPRNATFGSPQPSKHDSTATRQSQGGVDQAPHGGNGTDHGGSASSGGEQNATKSYLQRHPTFSADGPAQLHASSEVFYNDQVARTSAPSQEELQYTSQTIPPPTAYQPLASLEQTKYWDQEERRPENLKVREWESSVSTLSVMSTSTSFPETARKKTSS